MLFHVHLPSAPGANDVANAFATSVGSGAIKLRTAIIIAGFMEFIGAMLMGSTVTETIRSGIAYTADYEAEPEVLMYGLMCVLLSVGAWLIAATKMGLPVSTTHSTVGGIIGMSLVARGASSVNWGARTTDEFPWLTGVSNIILSWVFSPVLSGAVAALLFVLVRGTVLRTENPFRNALVAFPIIVGCTITVNIYFILVKGTSSRANTDEWPDYKVVAVSFGVGLGSALCVALCMPSLTARITALIEAGKSLEHGGGDEWVKGKGAGTDRENKVQDKDQRNGTLVDERSIAVKLVMEGLELDRDEVIHGSDDTVQAIHENAEQFDDKAEMVFGYMQVFSACCDAYAHGANDVANSMGPFAVIWDIYNHGIADESEVKPWILAIGGLGMVSGLGLMGSRIIKQIGLRLSKITPARGLCIELGAAIVVILGTKYGIPLSTTHCQVGATTGIALLEGRGGVNWGLFAQVVVGWVMTLVIAAVGAAIFTSQGLHAPYIHRYGIEQGFAAGVASCAAPPAIS